MLERFFAISIYTSQKGMWEKHFQFSFVHYCCICQQCAFQQQVFTKVVCFMPWTVHDLNEKFLGPILVMLLHVQGRNFFSFLESPPYGVPLSCMELPSPPWHLLILHIPSMEAPWGPTIETLQSWHLHCATAVLYLAPSFLS